MAPAAFVPPMVLLLMISVEAEDVLISRPRKPTVVPVPPELMVIAPMLLLETLHELRLKS